MNRLATERLCESHKSPCFQEKTYRLQFVDQDRDMARDENKEDLLRDLDLEAPEVLDRLLPVAAFV
jgi:hypothetical protein